MRLYLIGHCAQTHASWDDISNDFSKLESEISLTAEKNAAVETNQFFYPHFTLFPINRFDLKPQTGNETRISARRLEKEWIGTEKKKERHVSGLFRTGTMGLGELLTAAWGAVGADRSCSRTARGTSERHAEPSQPAVGQGPLPRESYTDGGGFPR